MGPALKANSYGSKTEGIIEAMDNFLAGDNTPFPLFEDFTKLTTGRLASSTKKNHSPPEHAIFQICQSVKEKADFVGALMDQHLLFLKTELIRTVRRELPARKLKKNILFFDDLLLRLRKALEEKEGEELARAVRAKYRAALIDEFQDTDPIQFAIFQAIFASHGSTLFFIGDPKQAIYSFRGADIFAYMKAASHTARRYTLGENWRSEPGLIKAINTIFYGADNPFLYDEISFSQARPAKDKDYEYLSIDGQKEAPLRMWLLTTRAFRQGVGEGGTSAAPEKLIPKSRARDLLSRAVAGEISQLLYLGHKGRVLIGPKPLQERDIAVLVRTNREARLVQESLSALRIPSVLYSTGSIFATHEARELERLLLAIAAPNREELIRAALVTDMVGLKGEDLGRFVNDEDAWGKWLIRFRNYHDLWRRSGFIVMFRSFMANEGVKARLLSLSEGERRLTNLLHLAEILHQQSMEQKAGMRGLIKWLGEERDSETPFSDEHQLRLESDEDAVRIVTIHKSKGLEYPVVFCPFAWGGSRIAGADISFHDVADGWQLTCDLGSSKSEHHKTLAERELLAENIRLLYVALTRAKNRCYLIWGRFNEAGTSAPAYLFHRGEEVVGEGVIEATEARFKSLSDDDLYRGLEGLAGKAEGTIRLDVMPMENGRLYSPRQDDGEALSCREFSGKIDRSFRIASFSFLISGKPHTVELPDHDAAPFSAATSPSLPVEGMLDDLPGERQGEGSGIFAFPRGTRAGTLLHDILEHLDFTGKNGDVMRDLVGKKLAEYGFEARWEETIIGMIEKVISLPLDRKRGLTFSAIPNERRLNELAFYFPLKPTSPERLRDIFAPYDDLLPANTSVWHERLHFNPVRGFMKGFMDMVFCFADRFYLVDWKSNFLGSCVTDYNQSALGETMVGSFYLLQYHLYTVALHQYLSMRLPDYRYDTHFGGVYYCFLRGMDPAWGPEYGVFWDRPSAELIATLTRDLVAGG